MPTDAPATLPKDALAQIQAIVFRAWKDFAWSAYHFVELSTDQAKARAYVEELRSQVAWADTKNPGMVTAKGRTFQAPLHVALTTNGLWRLGLDRETLDLFPYEAKAGMERRARVIGDPIEIPEAVDETFDQYESYAMKYDAAKGVGKPQPKEWTTDLRTCDVMVLLFARSKEELELLLDECQDRARRHGATPLSDERAAEWSDFEPFGFADGVSQPAIMGQPPKATAEPMDPDPDAGANGPAERGASKNLIAAGEIVLGYKNEYTELPQSPRVADGAHRGFDLGKNGTFLVFRKLEQDVDGFWRTFLELGRRWRGQPVSKHGEKIPDNEIDAALWCASRTMGRWPNGNSVMRGPMAEGPTDGPTVRNQFTYLDDKEGMRCPIGSHVRRANPRDQRDADDVDSSWKVVRRHRVIRRGRSYGEQLRSARASIQRVAQPGEPPFAGNSGLLFVCLQANITHGFEFVQQIWNNNPAFHGLYQEPDIIAGPGGGRFTIPAEPMRIELKRKTPKPDAKPKEDAYGLPCFVTARGGGYFFVPSRDALDVLLGHDLKKP